MSSTLCIRKTPKRSESQWHFKLPVKGWIAKKFYDHDGTCGGGTITVGPEHLGWFEGILIAASGLDPSERKELESVVQVLRDGNTIDMWFEF